MKKYNRMIKMLLTSAICASMLVGCNSQSTDSNVTTAAKETMENDVVNVEENPEKEDSANVTELTFMIWDSNQQAGMETMAADFTEKNPNIKVNVEVTPWDEYWTKLQAGATGGQMADVFWMHPEQVYTFAEGNALLNLSERIPSSTIDLTKYPEYITGDFKVDGVQYAIPKDYSTMGLWYNKDLFDAAGVAYPNDTWTWDDWKDAAAKLTDQNKGVYGMLAQCSSQDYYYNLIWKNGTDVITEDETDSLYDDPKTIEAIQYAVSFINAGYSPSTADQASTTALQYFESGKAAMLTGGSWLAAELTGIDGLNCDVAPLPQSIQRGSICGGMGYSASAFTEHPDEAWRFLEYLGSYDANVIQSESGAAISAYADSQDAWVKGFPSINAQIFVDASEYGYSTQYCQSRKDWVTMEEDTMAQIFAGNLDVEDGCKQLAAQIQEVLNEYKAE